MKKKDKKNQYDPNKHTEEECMFPKEDFIVKQITSGPNCLN